MRFFLLLALAAVAVAAPSEFLPIFKDYHEEIGIPEAHRIKATEDALDFDGSRIVGGSAAGLGLYPFMGGIVITLTDGRQSVCGSSLISNNRLVTAAHCWRHGNTQARLFTVVLGSVRLFAGGVRINTNNVQLHASYNQNNLNNDVAVIVIGHVGFNNQINRINLAAGTNLYVGVQANAIGFGRTGDNVNIGQGQVLSHVRVPVITNAECQRTYGGSNVVGSTICTSGAGGRSPCPGDSGGPLQIAGNILIGIVSFGHPWGCSRGFPAGYARVTAFNAWIRARM